MVGLARSGVAAALALRAQGAEVLGVDAGSDRDPQLAAAAGRLREAGVEVSLDASGEALAARAGALVKSPGVPQHAPAVRAARAQGVPVLGELEVAWRLLPSEFVAVTGTNGKTTTTEWIGHIHRVASRPVAVAGNVGTALSSLIGETTADTTIVCETSSFQLEDTLDFSPEAAVLLNLAPDHLDRHGSFDDYVAAKLRIFARQDNDDIAVAPTGLGVDDLGGCARRVCFGTEAEAELANRAGHLWWVRQPLIADGDISLPGEHNRQNAMAAAAVCLARGLPPEDVVAGLRSFRGVVHRLETVAVRRGVAYVNDSKATNVASTIVALRSFAPQSVHLIAGGRGKDQDFTPLAGPVARHCRAVYLIGEASSQLAQALAVAAVPVRQVETMERALQVAGARAEAESSGFGRLTVLLSPACASFDQFRDFEDRGEHFRALVEAL